MTAFCYTSGQSFKIVEGSQSVIQGTIGQNLKVPISIENLSSKPVNIIIKRIEERIGTSQKTYFCWGGDCVGEQVNQLPLSRKINPDQTSREFQSVLESGLVEGYSVVKYQVINRDNPSESYFHEVTYIIEPSEKKKALFESSNVTLQEVYPNPVNEFAFIDYALTNPETKAKIVLHNILGNIIGEYELKYFDKTLKISTASLNPGVYFYTLHIDNDGVMTKKIIVRR